MSSLLVIVTGAPGVGKSTLAAALSNELAVPLIAKDEIKEVLFDSLGTGDRDWSKRLGSATFDLMFLFARRVLEARGACILDANFSRAKPIQALPADRVVQFFCTAPREVVLARYESRERHPGHLDGQLAGELAERFDAGEWQPLDLAGETIVVDTTAAVNVTALARRVTVTASA